MGKIVDNRQLGVMLFQFFKYFYYIFFIKKIEVKMEIVIDILYITPGYLLSAFSLYCFFFGFDKISKYISHNLQRTMW